jgi:hypothetical protein
VGVILSPHPVVVEGTTVMGPSVGSSLHRLSDDALIDEVKRLVEKERAAEAELIAYLAEVDARRLYLREGCPSMFAYCTDVLHFSESAAYHRITAARAARRIPLLLEKLQAGEIHLSGLGILAPHLTPENHLELLARARHRSKREIEELIAELRPRPSAPSWVRRLPILPPRALAAPLPPLPLQIPQQGARREALTWSPAGEGAVDGRPSEASFPRGEFALPTSKARAASRAEPLGCERFRVQFTASRETRDQFVSPGGRRCESRERIEFHHRMPWGYVRAHSADGIELRCRAHNQYEAERVYGAAHMERCRGASRERIDRWWAACRER